MSTIHDALKRAQRERNLKDQAYSGVLGAQAKGKGGHAVRVILWVGLSVLIILLAFASYSWLDSKVPKNSKSYKKNDKMPQPPPRQNGVVEAKILHIRAKTLLKAGRTDEARALYEKALTLDPGLVDALNNLGFIYLRKMDYASAVKYFEKAVRLKPDYVDAYYNLACVYALEGKGAQGLSYLKKAVMLDKGVKEWARRDRDLQKLRGLPEFQELIRSK